MKHRAVLDSLICSFDDEEGPHSFAHVPELVG